jgi:hypothetical protein
VRCYRGAGEVLQRCCRGAAGCRIGAGEVQDRCRIGAAEVLQRCCRVACAGAEVLQRCRCRGAGAEVQV